MNNRLYCTFIEPNEVEEVSKKIQSSYKVLFDKIFVLESLDGEKIMLTYNVDLGNSNNEFVIGNTILEDLFLLSIDLTTKIAGKLYSLILSEELIKNTTT